MIAEKSRATLVLTMNTLAFAVCFAAWVLNGVLVTFLVTNGVFDWDPSRTAILIATPILTGSLLRLPVGMLADRFGGRPVYFVLMLLSAAALWLNSMADSYGGFLLAGLGFGLSGASFAVGVTYTSVWFPKEKQGTALGIFGVGNAGTALTLFFAPRLLRWLTNDFTALDNWRRLPVIYAGALVIMAFVYLAFTFPRKPAVQKSLGERLAPLRSMRVWRFGFYYFAIFGSFVALSQWLVFYYVKAYSVPFVTAGLFAMGFSLPCGLFRAVGGWLSDKYGARSVLYGVFSVMMLMCLLLSFPRMEVLTPGEGVLAKAPGTVTQITDKTMSILNPKTGKTAIYTITPQPPVSALPPDSRVVVLPHAQSWQTWGQKTVTAADGTQSVRSYVVGDKVGQQELLASGTTRIAFQANLRIFFLIVLVLGLAMGIGMAAVYKHIPAYFPQDVGTVGGLVGVLGGLGGYFSPIIFGNLLKATGLWTSCWMFLFALAILSLGWMHITVRRMMRREAPQLVREIEQQARA